MLDNVSVLLLLFCHRLLFFPIFLQSAKNIASSLLTSPCLSYPPIQPSKCTSFWEHYTVALTSSAQIVIVPSPTVKA
jgi:hypothetical protein